MKVFILSVVSLLLAVIALIVAIIVNVKVRNSLYEEVSNKLLIMPRFEELHEFVKVDGVKQETIRKHIKAVENNGFEYNKDNSFPNILCFTKLVKVEEQKQDE